MLLKLALIINLDLIIDLISNLYLIINLDLIIELIISLYLT